MRLAGLAPALLAALAAVLLTWHFSPIPLDPAPPSSHSSACARLVDRLPAVLAGAKRWPVTPPSATTAAWREPVVTLVCGRRFGATAASYALCLDSVDPVCAGGVAWYEDPFDSRHWTTRLAPRLDVTVPPSLGVADVLGPVSDALLRK